MRRRSPLRARLLALAVLLPLTIAAPGVARGAVPTGTAADGPGALSHFDLARKDCVGTARNTTLEGLVHGRRRRAERRLLPDQRQRPNNETLQYVVTDGTTFTDLQTRDMTYTVAPLDDRALTCRVTATAKSGRYRIVTDYLTDPGAPDRASCARASRRCTGKPRDYQLYVRFDPTLNGNGGGGGRQRRRRQRRRRDRRRPHAARRLRPRHADQRGQPRLRAARLQRARRRRRPSRRSSNGFAGQPSDGLTQLDAGARAHRDVRDGRPRQPRPDRRGRPRPRRRVHARARLRRRRRPRPSRAARGHARRRCRRDSTPRYVRRLARATTRSLVAPRRPRGVSRADWDATCSTSTTSAPTTSRRPRTRRSPAPSRPRSPRRGARRSPPATPPTPTSAPTARCSRATCTRRGRRCSSPATARRRAT